MLSYLGTIMLDQDLSDIMNKNKLLELVSMNLCLL